MLLNCFWVSEKNSNQPLTGLIKSRILMGEKHYFGTSTKLPFLAFYCTYANAHQFHYQTILKRSNCLSPFEIRGIFYF